MTDLSNDPVNRLRRYNFVKATVWGCIGIASTLTVMSGLGYVDQHVSVTELTVGGLLSLATALALAYVTGSVIDYNGGIKPLVMGRAADAANALRKTAQRPDEEAKG